MSVVAPQGQDASTSTVRTAGHSLTRAFPGDPSQVGRARAWAAEVSPEPVAELVKLAASELGHNAVMHTVSGEGGEFVVTVTQGLAEVNVDVKDGGTNGLPEHGRTRHNAEDRFGGNGMNLLAEYGVQVSVLGGADGGPRTTRATIAYPEEPEGR